MWTWELKTLSSYRKWKWVCPAHKEVSIPEKKLGSWFLPGNHCFNFSETKQGLSKWMLSHSICFKYALTHQLNLKFCLVKQYSFSSEWQQMPGHSYPGDLTHTQQQQFQFSLALTPKRKSLGLMMVQAHVLWTLPSQF